MGWNLALLLASFGFLLAAGDWVEIPQFSNQGKVYRAPVPQAVIVRHEITGTRNGIRNVSIFSKIHSTNLSNSHAIFVEHVNPYTTEATMTSTTNENHENSEIDSDEDIASVTVEEESMAHFDQPVIMDDSNEENEENEENEDMSTTTGYTKGMSNPTTTDSFDTLESNDDQNKSSFFDYLPIDLLKHVHRTLKSQPPTLKGKIRFLKVFERTLLGEIESRLRATIASPNPSRLPREARDDGDYDDKIGFPSLEGSLMAISFLTFAVYLVRLVMMLFRNAGAIGIAPIVIGRRKRSIDDFNEESVRIRSYLDSTFQSDF